MEAAPRRQVFITANSVTKEGSMTNRQNMPSFVAVVFVFQREPVAIFRFDTGVR